MFANWLAAQTEGEEDSDRERESAVQEPGEKMSLTLALWQPVPLVLLSNGDSAQPAVTFASQTNIVWFRAQIVVLEFKSRL